MAPKTQNPKAKGWKTNVRNLTDTTGFTDTWRSVTQESKLKSGSSKSDWDKTLVNRFSCLGKRLGRAKIKPVSTDFQSRETRIDVDY